MQNNLCVNNVLDVMEINNEIKNNNINNLLNI